jgi:ABC-type nickel/cobalt efflux system permease component RcnA
VRELRLSQSAFNHKAKQETKKKLMIGSLMMCLSVVVLLVGMLAGIVMGIEQNFTPAHAHLNLIGGVLLLLFGLYYRLVPAAGATTLAKVHG